MLSKTRKKFTKSECISLFDIYDQFTSLWIQMRIAFSNTDYWSYLLYSGSEVIYDLSVDQ